MKCDNACVTKCNAATPEQTIPCLETCGGCFENIVNIKWAPKAAGPHKLNEIEASFGPVELIADNEWEDIAQTFKQADIWTYQIWSMLIYFILMSLNLRKISKSETVLNFNYLTF